MLFHAMCRLQAGCPNRTAFTRPAKHDILHPHEGHNVTEGSQVAIRKLHFVYNVDATPQALIKDFIHRLWDPDTYPCRLCDVTYGRFVKKPGWQLFLKTLPLRSAFYTRDHFIRKFPAHAQTVFPIVLAEDERGTLTTFISADDFLVIPTLEALKDEVTKRLQAVPARPARRRASTATTTGTVASE
jgi:hypothetical protein